MLRTLADQWIFAREIVRATKTVGAIAPSGRHLAQALAIAAERSPSPRRILEVGAGTGAVTNEIVRILRPGDVLHAVEVQADFVQVLRRKLTTEPTYQAVAEQVDILHMPVQEVSPEAPYDFLICGLPFNAFPSRLVKEIFRHFRTLLRPGGTLTFFEYLWVRRLGTLAASNPERRRIARVGRILQRELQKHEFERKNIYANVPPAVVHFLRFSEAGTSVSLKSHDTISG